MCGRNCRRQKGSLAHKTLGNAPAVAAGVEFERWDLERVVEMTADYVRRKEDAKFEAAFSEL
jgi:hypothetical protein